MQGSVRTEDSLAQLRAAVAAESFEGVQLASSVADNSICRILIDPGVPCLVLSWRKDATSLQLRFILESVIEILDTEQLRKLLGDDGGVFRVSPEDQEWITQDWMPRAIRAGLLAAASVVPFSYSGKLILERIRSTVPEGLTVRSFERIDEAKEWLRKERFG